MARVRVTPLDVTTDDIEPGWTIRYSEKEEGFSLVIRGEVSTAERFEDEVQIEFVNGFITSLMPGDSVERIEFPVGIRPDADLN